ncbi:MAG: ribosome maturation factor RimP [Actinomycetota bacterium]
MSTSGDEARADAVRTAVEPVLAALGFACYDVEIAGGASARTLRVTVTREGGVDLEAITEATRAVSPVIDEIDVIGDAYTLEVSSPGLERPLRRPEHYAGARGAEVTLKVRVDGSLRRIHGVVAGADATGVEILDADGTRTRYEFSEIDRARTVFSWGAQSRSDRPRGTRRGEVNA